jgi:hypothetical protein
VLLVFRAEVDHVGQRELARVGHAGRERAETKLAPPPCQRAGQREQARGQGWAGSGKGATT